MSEWTDRAVWRKSSRSGTDGDCVEFDVMGRTMFRDSKNPDGPTLHAAGAEVFIAMVRSEEVGS